MAWKLISKVYYTTGLIFSSCQFVSNNCNKNQLNLNSSLAKETAVCEWVGGVFLKTNHYWRKIFFIWKNFIWPKKKIRLRIISCILEKNIWKKSGFCYYSNIFRQCFSSWGNFDPQGDVWQYLEVFLFVTTGGCYWHLAGRDQTCC